MKTKHIFVPALDIGESLPFTIRKTRSLKESLKEQDRAKKELVGFIDKLEKNFKEPIWYMGMDVIGEKSYERFIFEKGGFFEVMVESPVALNAHFVHLKRAKAFVNALRKTLKAIMPKNETTEMLLESIEVQDEHDDSLTVQKWDMLKEIRNL